MADITLAELNGRVWLVGGEAHIDGLLANALPKTISIELVACQSKSEVQALWAQNGGGPDSYTEPWMIHPAIVDRIRRGAPDRAVYFAQWSVALDNDALTVIAAAANWAHENPQAPVVLAEYLDPAGPQSIVDLSRLRMQMIEETLVERGVARDRIERERRDARDVPGMGQESQRVDVVVRTA